MGRTACTEPQCLYKAALHLFLSTQTGLGKGVNEHAVYCVHNYSVQQL